MKWLEAEKICKNFGTHHYSKLQYPGGGAAAVLWRFLKTGKFFFCAKFFLFSALYRPVPNLIPVYLNNPVTPREAHAAAVDYTLLATLDYVCKCLY
jgi:hypothetical protein